MALWSWGGHEALKYDRVSEKHVCEVTRVSTNDFLHQVLCVMISSQHKREEECFLATYLSKLTPQPSSILQVSLSNKALSMYKPLLQLRSRRMNTVQIKVLEVNEITIVYYKLVCQHIVGRDHLLHQASLPNDVFS